MRTAATRFTVSFSGCEGFYRSSVEKFSQPENPSAKPGRQLTPARQDPAINHQGRRFAARKVPVVASGRHGAGQ
jgi:hypothetical protein